MALLCIMFLHQLHGSEHIWAVHSASFAFDELKLRFLAQRHVASSSLVMTPDSLATVCFGIRDGGA